MQTRLLRILCVDDAADHREMVQTMLRFSNVGYEFTSVSTPEEGLKVAAAQRFDLYLLDYRFARLTGVDVCRTLRQTDADTPIVFFTGEAHMRERREAMEAGADAYLVKPDDLKNLTETVKQLLGARDPAPMRDAPSAAYRSRVSA